MSSRPCRVGAWSMEGHAGAIYISRSGWIKQTEEMCRESLSLLHTLFRKPGLQSISHLACFSPAAGGFVAATQGMRSGWSLESVSRAPALRPGAAQPPFVGAARSLCSCHRAPVIKIGRVSVLVSALVSWGSRCGPEPGTAAAG